MEIIAIEKDVFKEMNQDIENLLQQTRAVAQTHQSLCLKEKWLDSQEVCLLLGISKRALQNYKEKGLVPYSYIHRKNYYKRSDIEKFLIQHTLNTDHGLTD